MADGAPAVPFLDLVSQQAEVADEVLAAWERLLRAAHFVGGPDVAAFEREFAAYIGVEHVVGVANGTDALELAYRALGIQAGDEVILPVNTFIATAEAVTAVGATPVFVDVDDETLLIDPAAAESAITERTRAIVPVHLFGQTAPVEALAPLAARRGIAIVEDAAQSQGAVSAAGRAGALGTIAATSFYPGKNLGAAGDAGAVMTDDAARYADLLAASPGVRLPGTRSGNRDVWHLYVVRVEERDRVLADLAAAGVGAAIHYPTPLHLTDAYAGLGYRRGQFPVAERAAARILSLPMFPHLTRAQQERVASVLTAATSRSRSHG